MDQNQSYTRISELIRMAKRNPDPRGRKCDQALSLIEQTFRLIDSMSINEREDVMRQVVGWAIVQKFDGKGHSALLGIQRYCIADCLDDDPSWIPPESIESVRRR